MESKCPSEMAGKPIRCRAAVARKAGEPLVLEEIDVLPPKAWEVRIKILCTSLCHSDVTIWKLDAGPATCFPRIFGHEAVGICGKCGGVGGGSASRRHGGTSVPTELWRMQRLSVAKGQRLFQVPS
ncbi:Alcohol dehydrogenase-like 2 [Sesamum alatum]|uniref:Alcohol dehydrogenase-like 2 n=1 Tax=Sesamum alatum TaxID=300844 RepID=A0AAE1YPF4_9LAMI|nr:Alcohol dehydrogenase-like 2 [Sesamum alatum]